MENYLFPASDIINREVIEEVHVFFSLRIPVSKVQSISISPLFKI